jgi:predicted DNA binding CopG/RHH family protein
MKYYELDAKEQAELEEIENAFETEAPISPAVLKKRNAELKKYAQNTLDKKRNINIRLSEFDLHRLKVKAIEEGIPYQTLATSILHKAVSKPE